MAQRLVRTLCPHCKQPTEPPDDETWRAITSPWRAEKPARVMAPVGCLECRMTGYRGRIGLYEILLMTPGLRRVISADYDDAKMRELAAKEGMKPLRVSGAIKVAAGITTADEVIKVAPLA
jgi:general secretion pathway protein E